MDWTTQSEQQPDTSNGHGVPNSEPDTAVLQAVPAPAAPSIDQCQSCGALCNSDQRYCLACGQRRGEPRLPFMDAVVFMEAMKREPGPPTAATPKNRRRISPNAALIAGVGTLLLALGIGVLIGRSGGETTAAPQQAPIVIKSNGGGEATTTPTAAGPVAKAGGKQQPKKAVAKEKQQAAEAGKGAEEVLKPKAGVKLPPPTTSVGDKCANGTAGCEGGEFTGSFFGE